MALPYRWQQQEYDPTGATGPARPLVGGTPTNPRLLTPTRTGGGARPRAARASGGGGVAPQTVVEQRGPEAVTERPWDENLYAQLLGDVERFRTQALPDISAHQAELERQIGVRATAGLGSGPMARAARQQALVPIRAQFGAGAADRYLRQQGMLAQMGQGLLTPYGVRETTGRTDVQTTVPGAQQATGFENPFQAYGVGGGRGAVGIRAGYGPRGQFLG